MADDTAQIQKTDQLTRYILFALASLGSGYILYKTFKKNEIDEKKLFDISSIASTSASWKDVETSHKIVVSMQQEAFARKSNSEPNILPLTPSVSCSKETNELKPHSQLLFRHKYSSVPKLALSHTFLGESSYRETVIFLLAFATYRLFPDQQLIICNTFNFGTSRRSYFCRFESNLKLNAKSIALIQNEMMKLSEMQLELESKFIDFKTCVNILNKTNQKLSAKLVRSLNRRCYRMVGVDPYYILQYRSTLNNTKYCSRFKLHASDDCESHFVVKFTHNEDENKSAHDPFARQQPKAIRELYQHGVNMSRHLNICSVSDINNIIREGRFKELMLISEAYHNRQIVKIANEINHNIIKRRQIRIICISGPSSSGKTTFASKLAIQLRLLGMLPTVLEVDMFYRNRSDKCHPRDLNGNLNFEVIEAVKLTEFNLAINRLLNGEAIKVPKFDFKTGCRSGYQQEKVKLHPNNGVLIMEGIFCLNPKLLMNVKDIKDITFKIFICPISPFYSLDNFHFISEQVMRLIRRISRDHFHRGKDADSVVFKWGQLSEGEDLNIFPYVREAHAVFNSALLYEICVLKTYSYPLLQTVEENSKSYKDAQNLLSFLDGFFSMPDRSVPKDSLLMEFIGTSIFEEI